MRDVERMNESATAVVRGLSDESNSVQAQTLIVEIFLVLITSAIIGGLAPGRLTVLLPLPIIIFILLLTLFLILGATLSTTRILTVVTSEFSSELLQTLFFPALVFPDALTANLKEGENAMWQILWMIIPVIAANSILVGVYMWQISFSFEFSAFESIAFGGMTSQTDPTAIIVALAAVGAPKRLTGLLAGESLLNDAVALIIVDLFLKFQAGEKMSAGDIIVFSIRQTIVGPLLGIAFGVVALVLIRSFSRNKKAVFTISFAFPYMLFAICQFFVDTSPLLAIVSLGLVMNRYNAVIIETHMIFLVEIWETVEFMGESLLYALSGALIGYIIMMGGITALDWINAVCLYFYVSVVRFINVLASYPVLSRIGNGLNIREAILLWHGAMRGGVGLLISFYIREHQGVSEQAGNRIVFYMGIIIIGNLLKTVTISPLCQMLGLKTAVENQAFICAKIRLRRIREQYLTQAGITDIHTIGRTIEKRNLPTTLGNMAAAAKGCITRTGSDTYPARSEEIVEVNNSAHFNEHHDAIREKVCIRARQVYDDLLDVGLISRPTWLILTDALENKLIRKHCDDSIRELPSWDDILQVGCVRNLRRAVGRQRKICGKGNEFIEDAKEWNRFVDGDETLTCIPQGRVSRLSHHFLLRLAGASYSLLVLHERIRTRMLNQLVSFDNCVKLADSGLENDYDEFMQESLRCCVRPKHFLRLLASCCPVVLQDFKRFQLVHVLRDSQIRHVVAWEKCGFIDSQQRAKLMEECDATSAVLRHREIQLLNSEIICDISSRVIPFDMTRDRSSHAGSIDDRSWQISSNVGLITSTETEGSNRIPTTSVPNQDVIGDAPNEFNGIRDVQALLDDLERNEIESATRDAF